MSISFCTDCGQQKIPNCSFCKACGATSNRNTDTGAHAEAHVDVPADLPANSQKYTPWRTTGMGGFFASQATLCLFTLLVFLGLVVALAPAGWRYASLQLKSNSGTTATSTDTRSMGPGLLPAACNQIVVIFNSAATVARVAALLEQLDTTIAFGPNENGAFELSVPSTSASGVTDALNRAPDAVVSAALQRRCL